MTTVRMPWGKYHGEPITDIPGSYLLWVIENATDLSLYLRNAISDELSRRFARPCPRCAAGRPPETPRAAIDAELVAQWSRRLAMQFHPDRGGSDQAMAAINRGREILLAMIAERGAL